MAVPLRRPDPRGGACRRAGHPFSPRAAAGLDALPASRRDTVAGCIVAMRREGIPLDTKHLEKGQPWPDVIEYAP